MPPKTSEPSVGEEEEQYATPPRFQEPGGRHRSRPPRGRSLTPRYVPGSTPSEGTETPVGIPGEPQEAGTAPEADESSSSLGSTPLDREQADEPANPTKRRFTRLRDHVKKTRLCLLDEVTMREALEEKLSDRVMTLENVFAYQKEMTSAAMEQMRRDFQVELEQAKEALRQIRGAVAVRWEREMRK